MFTRLFLVRLPLGPLEIDGPGIEQLKEDKGPAILVPRHNSYFDIPTVDAAVHKIDRRIQPRFVSKKENLDLPVIGRLIVPLGSLIVDREDPDMEKLKKEMADIASGNGIAVVYAEGTRSKDGQIGKVHSGAARMALENSMNLYPIGLSGMVKENRGGASVAYFGERLRPGDYTAGSTRGAAKRLTRDLRDSLIDVQIQADAMRQNIFASRGFPAKPVSPDKLSAD